MNTLVTGYEGFIGNAMVGRLKGAGDFVVGIDKGRSRRDLRNAPDAFANGDIRDFNFVKKVLDDYNIEEVYHFAGQAIVKDCSDDPRSAFDVNVMGTINLLEACKECKGDVKSVVLSSSYKTFGNADVPYTEETSVNPVSVYEASKVCQQFLTLSYFHNFDVPVKIVICSNIYGPGDYNMSRIVPLNLTRLLSEQKALLSSGAKDFVREFVYVDDAIDGFIAASRKGRNGEIYCCGGTSHLKISDLIKKMCDLTGRDFSNSVEIFDGVSRFVEPKEQYIDAAKLKALGWRPKVSLDEGLKKSVDFYRNLL